MIAKLPAPGPSILVLPLLVLVLLVLLAAGCQSTSADEVLPNGGPWASEIAWEAGEKIGGCALGDIDPDVPGDEIVVVTGDHRVVLLRRTADGWDDELLATLDGEMIQCAVGEISLVHPGEEIVCVGAKAGSEDDPGPGRAILIYQNGGQFITADLYEEESLIHGVSVDEGGRVAAVGYEGDGLLFWPGDTLEALPDVEQFSVIGTDFGTGKAILAEDGQTVIVATAEGRLVRSNGIVSQDLWNSSDALARLGRSGDLMLCCDNGGRLVLFSMSNEFPARQIHDSADRLRGAVLADLSLEHEGVEAATAGYDGRVLVFDDLSSDAGYQVVATDNDRFHHLATGVVDGLGRCLVAVGYGGRVHVAYRLASD